MKIESKENTLFEVRYTTDFKKQLKKLNKQRKDLTKLEEVIIKLANKEDLDSKYKNHTLINNKYYKNCGECHIESD